ncbi:MAG TPA: TonB-dependent receptor [Chitinophagaceae bacterium]|nr:TonB-dependent receptor [Chitinophagaceae bacterium]
MKTSAKLLFVLLSILFVTVRVPAQKNIASDTAVNFKVFGVCEQCKDRVEGALKVKGIRSSDWNIDTKMLFVAYDPSKISLDKIHNKIIAVGHDTYLKKANDAVYQSLPGCCHYREMESMTKNISNVVVPNTVDSGIVANEPIDLNSAKSKLPNQIKGVVVEINKKGEFIPLQGASVMWVGTNIGTLTDSTGIFKVNHTDQHNRLTISFAGYKPDTISISDVDELKIILATSGSLNEVRVTAKQWSTYFSAINPVRTQFMNEKELLKAACCNLSESFETNPSVDVSYNDAVTGSKQIQLLGLSGNYTQLTVENLPGPRGLATPLGLNSIPGPWIEGIQLTKGTGSVANGFESIAGQINVELKKPQQSEKLYASLYVNDFGKADVNLNLSAKIGKKWSTGVLLHDDFFSNNKLDFNKDGFRDMPTGNLFSAINRWSYDNSKGLISQFGIKYLDDKRTGGQVNYNSSTDKFTNNNYGLEINTKRVEGFAKIGYVFPQKKYKSFGLQLSAFDHKQDSYFGMTPYTGHQQNFYSNLIYQSIIKTTAHKFRTGLSFLYDNYNEDFKANNYKRTEIVPGAFFEYTYTADKFSAVAGIREDNNNIYGWFTTPRLNVRYEPVEGTTLRASLGRGQRTANIFAENNSVFASARMVNILSTGDGAYGLEPEVAWNKGISLDQKFKWFYRDAMLGFDFFRNDFKNQVVVDLENSPQVNFYNLNGKSFSNSFQSELSFEPYQKLNVRLAYRWFDVKTTYGNQLLQKPLIAKNRAFANIAYELNGWKFDYTISYNGVKRIPSTSDNPTMYQKDNYSPSYVLMNTQVSKKFGKENLMELYAGAENLTNFYQEHAIISAAQPFNQYFDASLIWGPVSGRMLYAGWRFKIK